MAIKTTGGLTAEWYTLLSDESQETQFKVKPLTSAERLDVVGVNSSGMLGKTVLLAVQYGVTDWKGVKDDAGKDVPFATQALGTLPPQVLTELSKHIMTISTLTDAERKN